MAVELDDALAARINEVAPLTRRAMRESARAAQRRSHILASMSLAALVGTAATAMAFAAKPGDVAFATSEDPTTTTQIKRVSSDTVSRSQNRTPLNEIAKANASENTAKSEGSWQLNDSNSAIDVNAMTRSVANNLVVSSLLDGDRSALPAGFNPNHASGDTGNSYAFSQCTWWVYVRRHQLGLPVGSHMGNGNMWANSARALGYWVDNQARHAGDIMVFAAGQDGADARYGHVAIIEKINPDGSVVTSECGAVFQGETYSKTYSAQQVSQHQIIHY
jgi:surface antigen